MIQRHQKNHQRISDCGENLIKSESNARLIDIGIEVGRQLVSRSSYGAIAMLLPQALRPFAIGSLVVTQPALAPLSRFGVVQAATQLQHAVHQVAGRHGQSKNRSASRARLKRRPRMESQSACSFNRKS
jgi:hypothetical protein